MPTSKPSASQICIHMNTVIPSVTHTYSAVNLCCHKHVFTGIQLFLLSQIPTGKPSLSQTRCHWTQLFLPSQARCHWTQLFLLSQARTPRLTFAVTNTYSLEQLFLLSQILTGKPSPSQKRIHWNSYSFCHAHVLTGKPSPSLKRIHWNSYSFCHTHVLTGVSPLPSFSRFLPLRRRVRLRKEFQIFFRRLVGGAVTGGEDGGVPGEEG